MEQDNVAYITRFDIIEYRSEKTVFDFKGPVAFKK